MGKTFTIRLNQSIWLSMNVIQFNNSMEMNNKEHTYRSLFVADLASMSTVTFFFSLYFKPTSRFHNSFFTQF